MIRLVSPQDSAGPLPDGAGTPALAEPATARAVWPTFMRRTLEEAILSPQPSAPPTASAD